MSEMFGQCAPGQHFIFFHAFEEKPRTITVIGDPFPLLPIRHVPTDIQEHSFLVSRGRIKMKDEVEGFCAVQYGLDIPIPCKGVSPG